MDTESTFNELLWPLAMVAVLGLINAQASHGNNATQTTVKTYRVSGWQNPLVESSPNLGNYYWEPMTKRVINTTRHTGKQATVAALPKVVRDKAPLSNAAFQTSTGSVDGSLISENKKTPPAQPQAATYARADGFFTLDQSFVRSEVYGSIKKSPELKASIRSL